VRKEGRERGERGERARGKDSVAVREKRWGAQALQGCTRSEVGELLHLELLPGFSRCTRPAHGWNWAGAGVEILQTRPCSSYGLRRDDAGGDAVDLRYEKDMPKILLQNVFFSPDSS
jgi:hypothetical protein